uniref:Mitochondrial inner membrane protease subunit 2 n=1 Tax=Brassica oleracea var. oleracea TaxID=109376 RepID=A0A0D3CLS5_BRAOL
MGIQNLLWQVTKKAFTGGIIGVTISDRCCSVVPVRGDSMSPTFNPQRNSYLDDYVLVEKFCLQDYKFARGDVVVFSSPTHFRDRYIKRIVGLPGEWISSSRDVIRVPEGHCWVEGDNKASSLDSRTFGPIPLGLIRGRVTSVVWPPQRNCMLALFMVCAFYIIKWVSIQLHVPQDSLWKL